MNLFFERVLTRRSFLKCGFTAAASLALLTRLTRRAEAADLKARLGRVFPQPARYYETLAHDTVRCQLCPRYCTVPKGRRGFCRVRENRSGKYYTLAYSNPCSLHIDPIEKKPLFHFYPKSTALSLAMAGCNFTCKNCQNWDISQAQPDDTYNFEITPGEMAELAVNQGCPTIAYTYTEPSVFFEYVIDTAREARARGINNIIKSNGYLNPAPMEELIPQLDAANIDLKGFSEQFYRDLTGGTAAPVLATIRRLKEAGVWLEITNLIIPGFNDQPKLIADMCRWLVDNTGLEVPLHFSRFYPQYKLLDVPPTPAATLEQAADIARQMGIKFVYIGNVPELNQENTYCSQCGKLLIERHGFDVLSLHLAAGKCRYCRTAIPGRWSS